MKIFKEKYKLNMIYSIHTYETMEKFFYENNKDPREYEIITEIGAIYLQNEKVFISNFAPIPLNAKDMLLNPRNLKIKNFRKIKNNKDTSQKIYKAYLKDLKNITEKQYLAKNLEEVRDFILHILSNKAIKEIKIYLEIKEDILYEKREIYVKVIKIKEREENTYTPIVPYSLLEFYREEISIKLKEVLKNTSIMLTKNVILTLTDDKILIYSKHPLNIDVNLKNYINGIYLNLKTKPKTIENRKITDLKNSNLEVKIFEIINLTSLIKKYIENTIYISSSEKYKIHKSLTITVKR